MWAYFTFFFVPINFIDDGSTTSKFSSNEASRYPSKIDDVGWLHSNCSSIQFVNCQVEIVHDVWPHIEILSKIWRMVLITHGVIVINLIYYLDYYSTFSHFRSKLFFFHLFECRYCIVCEIFWMFALLKIILEWPRRSVMVVDDSRVLLCWIKSNADR